MLDGLELCPVDFDYQGTRCTGKAVIGHHLDHVWQTNSGHNTDDSQRDYELIESDASFSVFHGSTFLAEFTDSVILESRDALGTWIPDLIRRRRTRPV
jgi:hypothetical protein